MFYSFIYICKITIVMVLNILGDLGKCASTELHFNSVPSNFNSLSILIHKQIVLAQLLIFSHDSIGQNQSPDVCISSLRFIHIVYRERFSVERTERLIVTTTECVHSSHNTLESVTPTYSFSTRYSHTGPPLCSERLIIINNI